MRITNRHAASILLAAALTACDAPTPPVQETPDDLDNPGGQTFGVPFTTFTSSASAECPAVRAKSVLVDATRDGGVWWFPQSHATGFNADSAHQGRALTNHLRGLGYTVTELGRGATLPIDSLRTYAVVIRAGYYFDAHYNPGYSAGDLAAYSAYLACPRTLVLLSDHLQNGRRDALADSLGIPLSGISPATIITDFTAHALTAGVDSVRWGVGSFLESGASSAVQVIGRLPTGEAVMGVLAKGDARIFWMGDTNGMEWMPQPFLQNLIAWGFN